MKLKLNICLLLTAVSLLIYCQANKEVEQAQLPYKNLHDTVSYVGMETCRSCHQEIYETFIRTGMGQSFDHATPKKSAATFGKHALVYDSLNNFYYQPFWKQDSLFIKEFRLKDKDTTHQRNQYIKYIIGSGQHTNSHIIEENGYLRQAPITFYTQDKFWDLAPGFEGGFSSRFNRIIGQECMTCHNSYPDFVKSSENKFRKVPTGISCERCHGPGEIHVKEKLANQIVDTAKYIDYSIVNPKKLPRDLQMNVCQRCHLQGVAILKENKDFDDFKPSEHLNEVMDIFLPEFDGNETKFIMASQAHRLTKSVCYQKSDMTCISCHNPHISVKETPRQKFNKACISCHQTKICQLPETNKNDCSGCHMPLSGSIDIPHVQIHDHFIRKPISEEDKGKIENFIGLTNALQKATDDLTMAKAYLHYYESYSPKNSLLDSANYYLQKSTVSNPLKRIVPTVHLHYLKKEYDKVVEASKKVKLPKIKDAWTAYRIGESYLQNKELTNAQIYLEKALQILPLQLDFQHKLATVYIQQNDWLKAKNALEKLLQEHTQHISALTNIGFVYVNLGELAKAKQAYQQAFSLNPDYEPLLLNMAGLHLLNQEIDQAKKIIRTMLKKNPKHPKANLIWQQLKQKL